MIQHTLKTKRTFLEKKMKIYLMLLVCCLLFLGGCGDSDSSNEVSAKSSFYFTGDSPTHARALWKSDGTTAGTQVVKTFYTPPTNLLQVGDKVLFVADYPHSDAGIWQSDGTAEGTFVLKGPFAEISTLIEIDGNVYFLARNYSQQSELWKINLVSHEALLIHTYANPGHFGTLQKNGNSLLLSINYSDHNELWISDGTTEGSRVFAATQNPLEGIGWASSAIPGKIFIFRTVYDGYLVAGGSIWLSDGTEAGTTLVKSVSGEGAWIGLYEDLSDKLLLFISEQGQSAYWGVDKESALAERLPDIPTEPNSVYYFANVGRQWFFVVNKTDTAQKELWVTDGSAAGTKLLKSFTDYGVELLRGANNRLFFMVWPTEGALPALWTSDGTSAGTSMVTQYTAEKPCKTEKLLHFDGIYYYFLDLDVFFWKTDGTEAGTVFIKHLAVP